MKAISSFQKILLAFYAFIGLLIVARMVYTGSSLYLFLVWNIFLAWIPCMISGVLKRTTGQAKWKSALLFFCWLAFFPNALYIVTDLVHIDLETTVPKWFDALLLFSAAVLGLMLAFISLYRVEAFFSNSISSRFRAPLLVLILFLGSFGVYLGRFLRWNSWDIVSNPVDLLLSIGHRIVFPLEHMGTWAITLTFTIFFYLLYISIKKLPGYISQAIK